MGKDLPTQPVRPKAKRPGRRWGEGLASIMDLLGTSQRTIADDWSGFAELRPAGGEEAARAKSKPQGR